MQTENDSIQIVYSMIESNMLDYGMDFETVRDVLEDFKRQEMARGEEIDYCVDDLVEAYKRINNKNNATLAENDIDVDIDLDRFVARMLDDDILDCEMDSETAKKVIIDIARQEIKKYQTLIENVDEAIKYFEEFK